MGREPAAEATERRADRRDDDRASHGRRVPAGDAGRRRHCGRARHPPARVLGCPHRGRHGDAANAVRRARRGGSDRRGRSRCRKSVRPAHRIRDVGLLPRFGAALQALLRLGEADRASSSSSSSSTTATSRASAQCRVADGRLDLHWEQLARLDTLTLGAPRPRRSTSRSSTSTERGLGAQSRRGRASTPARHRGRRMSERALEALRSAAPDAYIVLDDDDRITHVSPHLHHDSGAGSGTCSGTTCPAHARSTGRASTRRVRSGQPVESVVFYSGRLKRLTVIPAADGLAVHVGTARRARRHDSRDADAEPGSRSTPR